MKKTVLFSALIALFTIFITPTISYAEEYEDQWGNQYDSWDECVSNPENDCSEILEPGGGGGDGADYGYCCHENGLSDYYGENCESECYDGYCTDDPNSCEVVPDCNPDSRCARCCIENSYGYIDRYNVCSTTEDDFPDECTSINYSWEEEGTRYVCDSCTASPRVWGGTGTSVDCAYLQALVEAHNDANESGTYVYNCSDDGELLNTGIEAACGGDDDCYAEILNNKESYIRSLCHDSEWEDSDLTQIFLYADYRYGTECLASVSGPRCDVMDAVYAHYRNTGDTLTCGYTYENMYQSNYYDICRRVIPDVEVAYDCHYNIAKNCEIYNAALDAVGDDPYGPYAYLHDEYGDVCTPVHSCDVLEYLIDAYNDSPNEDYYTLRDTACDNMSEWENEEEVEICHNNLTRMSYAYEPILEFFEGSDVTLGSFLEELSAGYNYNLNCSDWCPAGQYNKRGMCLDCPKGTYQYDEGMDYCYNCEAGSYQNQVGQTECKDCPSHTALSASGSKITVPATSPQAATKISDCHIAIDHKFRGLHGIYQFNPYCPYSE
ncbi:MAG: hypothetical protein E7006_01160 [Alphaproteobacteria bacterium]|nr:hypothetical protein [Alphaproteobacteria bacterium]